MAKCTLDDLVPSVKCKRVFLEPLGTSYSEYKVQIEACVQDIIVDEGDGIANYLITDTFKNNISFTVYYSRDASCDNLVRFLKQHSTFLPWELTFVFKESITAIVPYLIGSHTDDEILEGLQTLFHPDDIQNHHIFQNVTTTGGLNQVRKNEIFVSMLFDIAMAYKNDRIETRTIYLKDYSSGFINNYYSGENTDKLFSGEINFDDQGNRVYEFLLPRNELEFTNKTSVKYCYAHIIPYMDVQTMLENEGLSAGSLQTSQLMEMNRYTYGNLHTCNIISEYIAGAPYVQDFRLSERIEEIIRPDRISGYDDFVDKVSLITTDDSMRKSSITSDLFTSYKRNPNSKIYTSGIFLLSMYQLTKENTKHRFIYDNMYKLATSGYFYEIGAQNAPLRQSYSDSVAAASDFQGARLDGLLIDFLEVIKNPKIIKLEIYRTRTDLKGGYDRQRVASASDISSPIIKTDLQLDGLSPVELAFNDFGFSKLTYGTYKYELEFEYIDPIYDFIEEKVYKLKYGISVYKRVMEYIHNNAQNYDELRDTLNEKAKEEIMAILEDPSDDETPIDRDGYTNAFDDLMLLFTGVSPSEEETYSILVSSFSGGAIELQPDMLRMFSPSLIAEDAQGGLMIGERFPFLERRILENQLRVMEDLLTAIGKFFEIDGIVASSQTTVQSQREAVSYHRSWGAQEVNPRALDNGVIRLATDEDINNGFRSSDFRARMQQELDFYSISYSDSGDFGSISPISVESTNLINDYNEDDDFLALYSNLIDMGTTGQKEMEYFKQLIGSADYDYNLTANDIRNNSGLFESFLSRLGATCDNLSSLSRSITPKYSGMNYIYDNYSLAIDEGENFSTSSTSTGGNTNSYTDDDDEESRALEEQREQIKQALFLEAKKKEDIIMRILTHTNSYALLDRKDFTQGNKQNRRYSRISDFASEKRDGAFPEAWQQTSGNNVLIEAYNGILHNSAYAYSPLNMPLRRVIVDNTHLIYYLKETDIDMNPVWVHLKNLEQAFDDAGNSGRILCKFKRYRDSNLSIGQGSSSDKEILSKYFYIFK